MDGKKGRLGTVFWDHKRQAEPVMKVEYLFVHWYLLTECLICNRYFAGLWRYRCELDLIHSLSELMVY